MRALIPKSPSAKEMFRRSLGTEMSLYGRNGGGTLAKTIEFVKTTSSSLHCWSTERGQEFLLDLRGAP